MGHVLDDPVHEVVSLSWLVGNRLLYLFALADTRGRKTVEMGRPEEDIHLWKLVAEESGCFDHPYPFANDQARFLFYRQEEPSLHHVPFEEYRCTVTMMAGLPGSGKDTWLAANRPDLPVVSLDGVRGELGVRPTDEAESLALAATIGAGDDETDGDEPAAEFNPFLADDEAADTDVADEAAAAAAALAGEPEEEGAEAK